VVVVESDRRLGRASSLRRAVAPSRADAAAHQPGPQGRWP
jgi:hypothetical protein